MRIAREEVFGPVVSLIEFDTFEQAIEIANSIDYGLSTALYTRDVNRAFAAIRDLEAGITYINAPTIGAEVHLPFGGVKQTGNGHREGGPEPSTSTPRGKPSTSTTPTNCSAPRSTPASSHQTPGPSTVHVNTLSPRTGGLTTRLVIPTGANPDSCHAALTNGSVCGFR